jgi:RimJ/RimL family protein N-acetyltransferase
MESSLRAPRAFWSALRATPDGEVPALCGRGGHVLQVAGLRLRTPARWDLPIMLAAASDPQAQRWLGWRPQDLVPERDRERLLADKPGRGRTLSLQSETGGQRLVAVDPDSGRLAGSLVCDWDTGEIGGSLAPEFRGRGLGVSLFAGAAQFAHQHLGIAAVTAGTEPGNAACIAALGSAGFIPAYGPSTHKLPDGRVVLALWFRHGASRPARCR